MSEPTAATVKTLTAEVRTLVVGNRQVTMSVFNQLDIVKPFEIEVMGRVRPSKDALAHEVYVIGRHVATSALVRSSIFRENYIESRMEDDKKRMTYADMWAMRARYKLSRYDSDITIDSTADAILKRGECRFYNDGDAINYITEENLIDAEGLLPQAILNQEMWIAQHLTEWQRSMAIAAAWEALPLLVLAGLR